MLFSGAKSQTEFSPQNDGEGEKARQFFFRKIRQERLFRDILDTKECFVDMENEVLKKSKISKFSKRVSPWFLSKMAIFHRFFFLQNKAKKKMFRDILDRKIIFLTKKNEVLEKVYIMEIFQRD